MSIRVDAALGMAELAAIFADHNVLAEERQGRHRYLRLASTGIVELIETLASHNPPSRKPPRTLRTMTTLAALARARTCYDHLAGSLGVAVTDAMTDRGMLRRDDGWTMTSTGLDWLQELGADTEALRQQRRPMVRRCLDWTERRHHLAGAAGAAICSRLFEARWIERIGSDRAIRHTTEGAATLRDQLDLRWTAFANDVACSS